jgi:hypothetical protein
MEFLLSHWHCIVPAIVVVAVSLLMNRKKKTDSEGQDE